VARRRRGGDDRRGRLVRSAPRADALQARRAHLDRLAAIKATWDPENLFNTNKNVAPRR
jgi:hypothetical protein